MQTKKLSFVIKQMTLPEILKQHVYLKFYAAALFLKFTPNSFLEIQNMRF